MPSDAPDDLAPCPFMSRLIDLLGEVPAQRDRRRSTTVGERLARLDDEARRDGAPATTLAAIKGARVLLTLAEMPPQGAKQVRTAR